MQTPCWLPEYATEGPDVNVELNALEELRRDYLEDLIKTAITGHLNADVREHVENCTAHRREQIWARVKAVGPE